MKHKPDLKELTINQLSMLTGSSYRTIKRRLAEISPTRVTGNSTFYDPRQALPAIFLNAEPSGEALDLSAERARLAKVQADRQALLLERERGNLVDVEAVGEVWGGFMAVARTRLLQLPYACAQGVPIDIRARTFAEAERIVHDALEELSQGNDYDYTEGLAEEGSIPDASRARSATEKVVGKDRAGFSREG